MPTPTHTDFMRVKGCKWILFNERHSFGFNSPPSL